MKTPKHRRGTWRWMITEPVVLATVGCWILIAVLVILNYRPQSDFIIPDEKVVAEALLAQQFTGPRYFHGTSTASGSEPYVISPAAAKEQVARIIRERQWTNEDATRINALIDTLTEPPQSRAVGYEHVNLLKLNLALDALK